MIVTLIKNGERSNSNPCELNYTDVSNLIRSAVMMMHFCGKRPLYTVSDNGTYKLNIPQDLLPVPNMLVTETKPSSYTSGKVIIETLKEYGIDRPRVLSNKKINRLKQIPKDVNHLIIVGSDEALDKWCKSLHLISGIKRISGSPLCIIKDSMVFYDEFAKHDLYMQDGIMDTRMRLSLTEKALDQIEENLRPYKNKIPATLPAGAVLARLYKDQDF